MNLVEFPVKSSGPLLFIDDSTLLALSLSFLIESGLFKLFTTNSINFVEFLRRLYGEGNGNPLWYSCLENPMDGRAWWAAADGVAKSDMTEQLHFHFSLSCVGEGSGNPLQCSCLENPRDGGAWWAAVYGVTQSQTRLKQLSSSSRRRLYIMFRF